MRYESIPTSNYRLCILVCWCFPWWQKCPLWPPLPAGHTRTSHLQRDEAWELWWDNCQCSGEPRTPATHTREVTMLDSVPTLERLITKIIWSWGITQHTHHLFILSQSGFFVPENIFFFSVHFLQTLFICDKQGTLTEYFKSWDQSIRRISMFRASQNTPIIALKGGFQ